MVGGRRRHGMSMGSKLSSVQALRALAALAVVAHHSLRATTVFVVPPPRSILVPPSWLVQFGTVGVDVFFVISGFLMAFIADPFLAGGRSPARFLAQRIIRIWPPYVVANLLACGLIVLNSTDPPGTLPFDLHARRLLSLVFLPSFNGRGLLQPIIGPGWTLNYEAMFYACFALALLLGRRLALPTLAAVLASLFLVGRLSPPGVVHAFLGNPIVFEFLLGAAIGFALKAGWFTPARPWAWIAASAVLLVALKLCGLGAGQRLLAYGLPAATLFVGVLALERVLVWPRALLLLGDASYSIYLTHTLVIYWVIYEAGFPLRRVPAIATVASSLFAILVAVACGLLFHWLIERPLLRAARGAFDRAGRGRSDATLAARALPRGPVPAAGSEK